MVFSMSFTGIVRDGVITLQPGMKLPDGTKVSVTPLGQPAARLHDYRKDDPDFEGAIAAFAEAEANDADPLEGEIADLAKDASAREQLRKLLAGA